MPNNTPMGRQGQGLNMNIPESAQAIENPQNNEEVYLSSGKIWGHMLSLNF